MTPRRRTTIAALAGAFAVVVVLAAVALAWFFRDDAPAEVDLDAAASGVEASSESVATSSTAPAAGGIAGTWKVDDLSGSFDYETATGTFAGFRIAEELRSIGSTEAVGRTGDVTGQLVIEGTTVRSGDFTVDLTTITTNESRRDDKVQSALETGRFPAATFALTGPIALGAGAADGSPVQVSARGDLTIHGVTKPVTLPIEAKLVEGRIVLVGSLDLTFSDYGVKVPTGPAVLSVDDHGKLEVQLLLVRG